MTCKHKKSLGILLGALIGVAALLLLIPLGFKLVDLVRHISFYSVAEATMPMPGIHDGFIQQGFDYVTEEKAFLVTGYMKGDDPSRVYVLREDGSTTVTALKKADGKDYTGHTGGIAHFGDYVYITGGKGLDVFSYSEIMAGKESAECLGTVITYNDPAHCYIVEGHVLVGSFYRPGNYDTEDYQHITTPCGDRNRSIITVFRLDGAAAFGIDPAVRAVISTPDQVQGMCVTDKGTVVLSTSYGLATSVLLAYDTEKLPAAELRDFAGKTENGDAFSFTSVPYYFLESAAIADVIEAPPMSEELVYQNGRIYIMNESASNKYIFGKITSGGSIYAYPYDK